MLRRENYLIDNILYLRCKSCWELKPSTEFYKQRKAYKQNCKICRKKKITQRNKDHPEMHRKYYNNRKNKDLQKYKEKRKQTSLKKYQTKRDEIIKKNTEYRKRKNNELGFSWRYFHKKTKEFCRKYDLYPKRCPICWDDKSRIEIHHPFYNKFEDWSKVIFCCSSCHNYIHSGKIKNKNYIELHNLSLIKSRWA